MDVSNGSVAHAGVEERVLSCTRLLPTDLALHILLRRIDNSTVNLNDFLITLFAEGGAGCVVTQGGIAAVFLRRLLALIVLTPVVLDIELDPAQLDHIALLQLVVEVVLGRLGVSDHDEHLVVHVLV